MTILAGRDRDGLREKILRSSGGTYIESGQDVQVR